MKRELDKRLEATGGDFKIMRDRIREVATLLALGALLQIITLLLGLGAGQPFSRSAINALLAVGMSVGAILIEAHPTRAITGTALVWVGVQVVLLLGEPPFLSQGLLLTVVTLVMLGRGVVAAWKAEQIRKQMSAATAIER